MDIKLNKAEKEVLTRYQQEINSALQGVGKLVNDLMHFKVTELGRDKGINFEDGDWKYDAEEFTFSKVDPPKEVTPVIPKKRPAKKTNAKTDKKEKK